MKLFQIMGLILLSVFPLFSVNSVEHETVPIPLSEAITESKNTLNFNGKITYVDVEGGFYGITAEDGRRFMPTNLPDKFKQTGLVVAVQAILTENVIGIHMWGQYIELLQIDVLSVAY
jgi:hypothetical protein